MGAVLTLLGRRIPRPWRFFRLSTQQSPPDFLAIFTDPESQFVGKPPLLRHECKLTIPDVQHDPIRPGLVDNTDHIHRSPRLRIDRFAEHQIAGLQTEFSNRAGTSEDLK